MALSEQYRRYLPYLLAAAVILLALLALWLRLAPLSTQGSADMLDMSGSDDPLYNFRQVDQILHNYPAYAWFDAMTLFPTGELIYWGPLFPTLIATLCLITGAATQNEIIYVALLTPPILAFFMVPLVFLIGRRIADWKTGLLAALFIAIIAGQYFQRSLFGYADHHMMEVLFSTLFCFGYLTYLAHTKSSPVDLSRPETLKLPAILAALTGGAYLLGLFTMPTMILFALIVAAFTVVQYFWDFHRDRSSDYLLLANVIIFGIAIIGLLLFGIKHPGLDLSRYTIGHVYAYLMIIVATGGLAALARYLKGKGTTTFLLAVAGAAVGGVLLLALLVPDVYRILIASLFAFFGQQEVTQTVQEARGWSLQLAWAVFQFGLLLMVGGILAILYRNYREEHPDQVYVLVWSLIVLFATIQHVRYEYYLAVNIALLAAMAIGTVWAWGGQETIRFFTGLGSQKETPKKEGAGKEAKGSKRAKKGQKQVPSPKAASPALKVTVVALAAVLGILFVVSSLQTDALFLEGHRMNQDWRESLEWMGTNTPDTGVDYYAIDEKATYTYPATAYGVMSWWDYGHQITYIARRIPNANPFQRGVAGPYGAASYFMTESEDYANSEIADRLGTRYVVTDIEMDVAKFWAMSTWYNATVSTAPYQAMFLYPSTEDPERYETIEFFTQHYYETMISRLHNFDGSLTDPSRVYYLEYMDPQKAGTQYPVLTAAKVMNATEAAAAVNAFNARAPVGSHATALSDIIFLPIEQVPALRHYRLIHESPTNVFSGSQAGAPEIKYVKVFEYVKGARIRGEGIIQVPLVTNTGRSFVYRQMSENGEFVVPYSTEGGPAGVRATGKYRIEGTGQEFSVTEQAVIQGLAV
ncbi:MAG: oligosaccharyl transferase, archaeosortase A system-associated [Methanomicrobiales archaeon]|nr:oligosaccharyl transferase, archaeosortase A system-associated [Methanomicrobiales archaeon]